MKHAGGLELFFGNLEFFITSREIRFRPAPPSTNILVTWRLRIVGGTNNGKHPIMVVRSGWSSSSKMMGMRDHFQQLLGVRSWLHDIDFSHPLLELAVRGVQRGTSVNAHGLSCFLELMPAGIFTISPIIILFT